MTFKELYEISSEIHLSALTACANPAVTSQTVRAPGLWWP